MSLQEAAYRLREDSCLHDQPGPDRRRTSPSDDPGRVHVGMNSPFTPEATEALAVPVPGIDATNTQGVPVATARDPSPSRPRTTVPLARLAADMGLVRFHDPGESLPQERIRSHERPDPVRQAPGAPVADPEPQGQPSGTAAMSGSGHEIHGQQPGF